MTAARQPASISVPPLGCGQRGCFCLQGLFLNCKLLARGERPLVNLLCSGQEILIVHTRGTDAQVQAHNIYGLQMALHVLRPVHLRCGEGGASSLA